MIPAINGKELKKEGLCTIKGTKVTFHGGKEFVEVFYERLAAAGIFAEFEEISQDETVGRIFINIEQTADLCQTQGAYRLEITEKRIDVMVSDSEGIANALTTLYWMLREGGGTCSCGIIEDTPKHLYRGFMLDCCRHFFDVAEVKKMIEQCALRKINRLHWHLSEDQGFRLESQVFPKLNEISSVRREADGTMYGGYYKKEEVREIIRYAKVRGMEVIPEIDLPGHVSAMISAYPELSCSCEPLEIPTGWGVFPRILCAGKDEALDFISRLLREVCELFPYEYIHIGGDEAPKDEWKSCPHCQQRILQEGLKDEEELQAWFTGQMQKVLEKNGKKIICWNDVQYSGKPIKGAWIQYWEEFDQTIPAELVKGQPYIYSKINSFYFDYQPQDVPLRNTYQNEPVLKCGIKLEGDQLLGFEAPLWAERILDGDRLEQMAFPRMLALAERAWNGERTYEEFLERCAREIELLWADGVSCLSIEEADPRP